MGDVGKWASMDKHRVSLQIQTTDMWHKTNSSRQFFWVVKLFSVELLGLACVFHPPPRSASDLAWWHLSLAQLEPHSHPTDTNSALRSGALFQQFLYGLSCNGGDSSLLTRSSVVMGCPLRLVATTILARRWRMSSRLLVSASTAMISLATVMSNWAWRTERRGACYFRQQSGLWKRKDESTDIPFNAEILKIWDIFFIEDCMSVVEGV